ncbi:hypothetical protein O159_27520 [Leifsonia xyli subsp. cynodontis DSM 46306]|uniref:DUF58 domain-containing protein n=1 Tax=Leifsonia xyli subsp. cynodontis DSM 46306 TaxID=1389489 RepID=U3PG43_LEIXC|nr:DUF58 domain-containing protein [Leifsonia xyli]AGW42643.1 hypothetical protein O159_27520 [Leifsonia xyli subsp. cynodontis DSM 46306]
MPGPERRWALERLRAALGHVTGTGRVVVAAGVGAFAAGLLLGWKEAVAAGAALLMLSAGAVFFLLRRPGDAARLEADATRTVVGCPVAVRVVLGAGTGRRWASRVEVRIGDEVREVVPRGSRGGVSALSVPALRRGLVVVGPVRTVRGDPVGLYRREVESAERLEVRVHPVTVAVPAASSGYVRDLEGTPTRDLTASDLAFHTLREYAPGDDRRHISWKSTARSGDLMVRQFEETRRSHLLVAFSLAERDYADEEEFELAVSAAASIAVRAVRDGRRLSVVTGNPADATRPALLPTIGTARLLDALAEVQLGSARVGIGRLSRLAAGTIEDVSLAYLVCGTAPTMRELRSWALRFPAGAEIVVVVCGPGRLPTLRRIGGLTVLTIGFLDDLGRSLGKAAA